MNHRTIRKNLIHHQKALSDAILKDIMIEHLCPESLSSYFQECMRRDFCERALEAAIILDSVKLPRGGKIIDESGGFFTQRAARIASAKSL